MRRAVSARLQFNTRSRLFTTPVVADTTVEQFHRDGIVCIPSYVPGAVVDGLREEVERLTRCEARAREQRGESVGSVFDTVSKEHVDNEYWMTSGDKIRFFLEKDSDGTVSTQSVNKIGHALHCDGSVFQQFVQHQSFGGLLRRLGQRQPSVIQSMYIMKPPRVGGEVVPHQDSTWLHTRPVSCIGLWFALEDCTIHNSCLLALKGSHNTHPLSARCVLQEGSTLKTELNGPLPQVSYADMEPLECPKGSLVAFCGQVVHGSGPNYSDQSRHAFVFHSVDDACAWNERNWLAPTVARLAL